MYQLCPYLYALLHTVFFDTFLCKRFNRIVYACQLAAVLCFHVPFRFLFFQIYHKITPICPLTKGKIKRVNGKEEGKRSEGKRKAGNTKNENMQKGETGKGKERDIEKRTNIGGGYLIKEKEKFEDTKKHGDNFAVKMLCVMMFLDTSLSHRGNNSVISCHCRVAGPYSCFIIQVTMDFRFPRRRRWIPLLTPSCALWKRTNLNIVMRTGSLLL